MHVSDRGGENNADFPNGNGGLALPENRNTLGRRTDLPGRTRFVGWSPDYSEGHLGDGERLATYENKLRTNYPLLLPERGNPKVKLGILLDAPDSLPLSPGLFFGPQS